jgi:single-stranded DNA-binding protein
MADLINGIECCFLARVGSEPELRTGKESGKPWGSVRVCVGSGDDAQWIQLATFGERAHAMLEDLAKGDRIYALGTLRLDNYTTKEGEKRASLKVSARRVEKIGVQGKPQETAGDAAAKRDHQRPLAGKSDKSFDRALDDEIAF